MNRTDIFRHMCDLWECDLDCPIGRRECNKLFGDECPNNMTNEEVDEKLKGRDIIVDISIR